MSNNPFVPRELETVDGRFWSDLGYSKEKNSTCAGPNLMNDQRDPHENSKYL